VLSVCETTLQPVALLYERLCVFMIVAKSTTNSPSIQLCFFLVDDGEDNGYLKSDPYYDPADLPGITYLGIEEMNVLTSKDVPSQARACNLPTIAFLLRVAFRQRAGRFVPDELINLVLEGLEGPGAQMTRQEAEERRRDLMDDRRVNVKGANGVGLPRILVLGCCTLTLLSVLGA
jgi:hypothetical protein